MQILIGCAKDMDDSAVSVRGLLNEPMFASQAAVNALQMMRYDEEELSRMLGCNMQIARLNRLRYSRFHDDRQSVQAVSAYTGVFVDYLVSLRPVEACRRHQGIPT